MFIIFFNITFFSRCSLEQRTISYEFSAYIWVVITANHKIIIFAHKYCTPNP